MNHLHRLGAPTAALLLVALAALAVSACGGGGSSSSSSSGTSSSGTTAKGSTTSKSAKKEGTQKGEGQSSQNGKQKQGEGKAAAYIRHFGHEASASQAEPIEAAFHAYLGAFAAGEWSKACSHLTATAQRRKANNAKLLGAKSSSCAANLQASAEVLTSYQRASLAKAEASSVRVQDDSAYVLYEAGGAEAAILARREAGEWKVGGSLPSFPTSNQSMTHHSDGGESK